MAAPMPAIAVAAAAFRAHPRWRLVVIGNGNVALDVTELVHPTVAAAAALAARVVGLDIAGVDMVLQDCSLPLSSQRACVIEVNASPGLLSHIKPANGEGQPVGKAFAFHVDDFCHASDLGGSRSGGTGVVAGHQHMHVAAALGGCGDGVQGRRFDAAVVVFSNDERTHGNVL